MADGQLNYEVILDDKSFNRTVNEVIKTAKDLNVQVSRLVNLKNVKYPTVSAQDVENARNYNKILREENRTRELNNREMERTANLNRNIQRSMQESNASLVQHGRLWRQLSGLAGAYFSVSGAEKLVSALTRVTAEFELQKTTLGAILQDQNAANTIFEQIKSLAVMSPFSFKELVTYTKQLSAFSVPMGELYETTKMLADVSAGLGVGMDRLVLAYGQIRSASFLRGQEVRQLTEAGIPILTELAKQFEEIEGRAVSVGEVFDKISARQVPFEMVAKVFTNMTSEGGKFYKMQEIQAETLRGKLSNLKDAYDVMFSEIGNNSMEFLKGSVDAIRGIADNYQRVGRNLTELVVAFGVYKTALITTEVVTKTFTLTNHKLIASIVGIGKALATSLASNPYILLAAEATAAAYAVYKLGQSVFQASELVRNYEKNQEKMNSGISAEVASLDALYAKLTLAKEGTKEYDAARNAILSKYGDYLNQIKEEGVAVDNLASVYDNLKNKIVEAASQRFKESSMTAADKDYGKIVDKLYKSFSDRFKKGTMEASKGMSKATAVQKEAVWQWITGAITKEDAKRYVPVGWLEAVKWIKNDFAKAAEEYSNVVNDINLAHDRFKKVNDTPIALPKFAEMVQNLLGGDKDANKFKGLWADQFTQYSDYLDGLKKRYAELKQQIDLAGNAQDEYVGGFKEELAMIVRIARTFDKPGSNNIYDYITGASKGTTGKTQAQKDIETRISTLKDLLRWFDKLSAAGMGEDDIKDLLKRFFPSEAEVIDINGYRDALLGCANALEKYDKKQAQALRDDVSGNNINEEYNNFKKAKDAAEQYANYINGWLDSTDLAGFGSSFDISKILHDYTKTLSAIEKKKREAREKLQSAQDSGAKGIDFGKEFRLIEELGAKESADALAKASEAVRKEADDWVKSWDDVAKFDISNMSDMSIRELRSLRNALKGFSADDIPQDIKDNLNQIEGGLDAFILGVEQAINTLDEKAVEKLKDKVVEEVKQIANSLKDATASVKEFAEASDNMRLADAMDQISNSISFVTEELTMILSGNEMGAIVNVITEVVKQVMSLATAMVVTKNAIADANREASLFRDNAKLDFGVDTIFGENAVQQISNALSMLEEKSNKISSGLGRNFRNSLMYYTSIATSLSGDGAYYLKSLVEGIGYNYDDLAERLEGIKKLIELSESTPGYKNMSKADKEYLKDQRDALEEYLKAEEALTQTISDLWSSVAGDIADKMINAYIEMGDAAYNLAENMDSLFSDLAKSIAQSLVSSFLIDNVLSKYTERIGELYRAMTPESSDYSPERIAMLFGKIAEDIARDAELGADFTNRLMDALARWGITFDNANSGTETLANGIKSVTEDTANLLASYINAIRADVSVTRGFVGEISADVKQILGLIPSCPNLDLYLAQISANTSSILARLDSVITTESGETSFRTYNS